MGCGIVRFDRRIGRYISYADIHSIRCLFSV